MTTLIAGAALAVIAATAQPPSAKAMFYNPGGEPGTEAVAQPAAPADAPQYPPQRALPREDMTSCGGPEYTDADRRAMAGVTEIRDAGSRFPGSYLFVPATKGPHPGIIMLHGSGGGRFTPGRACVARLTASYGYATLAFCYFDCGDDSIPEALADVDLERTYQAMVWLKRSPYVQGKKILLNGASRGAEKAALLASLLAAAVKTDPSIVVPDALYASAPYGRVVGVFNWRRNPDDYRWERVRTAYAACRDLTAPGCGDRPALDPSECWVDGPSGHYEGPDGRRRSWVTKRCAAEPNRPGQIVDVGAWRWNRDPARARPGTEINLADFRNPILVAHGSVDPLWSVEDGPAHLRRTLGINGVQSHWEVVPKFGKRVSSWPALPRERVLFYIFDGEPHAFSTNGVVARRQLFLAFLRRSLQ
jgi:dienelactone hydrolase